MRRVAWVMLLAGCSNAPQAGPSPAPRPSLREVPIVGTQLPREGKLARANGKLLLDLPGRRTLEASLPTHASGAVHLANPGDHGAFLDVTPRDLTALEGK